MKAQRQGKIAQLIRSQPVTSQEQLVELLHQEGLDATQATVSRDLEELGAVKVRREGKMAYSLEAASPHAPMQSLKKSLSSFVLSVEPSGNLVVLRTPPGHAGVVASALDHEELEFVAGTVAGDDTILIVCREGFTSAQVAKDLRASMTSPPNGGKNGANR